ncbi:MAG: phytanoyl-CoA dioxygenase family protein [Acidobacteriota bacterium]|nr:phytanoyl-CoA dioxygenase family protein [Acidobacteriota bacterium]
MSTHLSPAEVEAFHDDGFHLRRRVLGEAEAADCRRRLEAFEAASDGEGSVPKADLHLLFRWAWDLVHDPRIVDPVVDLLGPDVLLWSLNWFIKEAHSGKFVSYHQDATYWGLEPHDVVTAWVALSDASAATGPMKFIPGTHRDSIFSHTTTYEDDNLLTRGQTIENGFDGESAVLAPLRSGEMSLHHVRLVHGSEPNTTPDRRIGLVLRYCAPHVCQTKIERDTATLVAGRDVHGNFDLMDAPTQDMGSAEVDRHRDAVERLSRAILS